MAVSSFVCLQDAAALTRAYNAICACTVLTFCGELLGLKRIALSSFRGQSGLKELVATFLNLAFVFYIGQFSRIILKHFGSD